jgi:hypothetical protein
MARRIRAFAALFPKKVSKALYMEAELVAADAKDNYVPVDDGPLRDSITALAPGNAGQFSGAFKVE